MLWKMSAIVLVVPLFVLFVVIPLLAFLTSLPGFSAGFVLLTYVALPAVALLAYVALFWLAAFFAVAVFRWFRSKDRAEAKDALGTFIALAIGVLLFVVLG